MKFTLKVIMNKKPGAKGKCLLYLQAFINGDRFRSSIGVAVEPVFFDPKSGLVKESCPNCNDFNIIIRNKISKANAIAGRYRILEDTTGQILTREIFEREFNSKDYSRGDFLKWYEKRLNYRIQKNIIKETTAKNERSTLNKLKEFRNRILFSDLTCGFMDDFNLWMIERGNNQNTRWGQFKHLHSYCEEARSEGMINIDPFEKLDCKSTEGPIIYLEKKEINSLLKYFNSKKISSSHYKVLRYFLFACFTGLRISDVKRISFGNIINGVLVFVPKKTERKGKITSLPLSGVAKEFVKSFKPSPEDAIFETMKDQPTNRILKEISLKCKIKKRITFHVARHSFATLYLEMGGKVQVLQQYLGHTKIQTTMRYVHVVDKEKKKEIKRFDVFKK